MRIIGGHDYYDSAQAMGQDLELVFLRTPLDKAVAVPQKDFGLRCLECGYLHIVAEGGRTYDHKVDNRHGRFQFTPRVLWFAGRRYACVRIEGQASRVGAPATDIHMWSAAEVRSFLSSVGVGLVDWGWGSGLDEKSIDAWFSDSGTEAEKNCLIERRVSIALSDAPRYDSAPGRWKECRVWKVDTDGLKAIGFARILPPWEAFQQLSMWVGGTLAQPGRETVEIKSDVVRRDKHGFDDRSFKKAKVGTSL